MLDKNTLVFILICLVAFFMFKNIVIEGFDDTSDCTGIMGTKDRRFPHYRQLHSMYIDPKYTGPGSCIYERLPQCQPNPIYVSQLEWDYLGCKRECKCRNG